MIVSHVNPSPSRRRSFLSKRSSKEPILRFPKGFLWGSATSSYQVEGGNTNNQWYEWEAEGGHIKDGSVCGRADDFYHLYEKDLDLAKETVRMLGNDIMIWSGGGKLIFN